jgi:hypothetical protein
MEAIEDSGGCALAISASHYVGSGARHELKLPMTPCSAVGAPCEAAVEFRPSERIRARDPDAHWTPSALQGSDRTHHSIMGVARHIAASGNIRCKELHHR